MEDEAARASCCQSVRNERGHDTISNPNRCGIGTSWVGQRAKKIGGSLNAQFLASGSRIAQRCVVPGCKQERQANFFEDRGMTLRINIDPYAEGLQAVGGTTG